MDRRYGRRRSVGAVLCACLAALLGLGTALAQDEGGELLDPKAAFALSLSSPDGGSVLARWEIADGYYLYREQFKFASQTPGVELGEPSFPAGKIKQDDYFGEQEVYRGAVEVAIPLVRGEGAPATMELKTVSQGCADAGICYPPQTEVLPVELPVAAAAAKAPGGPPPGEDEGELLDPDEAFELGVTVPDPRNVSVSWKIADGYYLYRERMSFELEGAGYTSIAEVALPDGKVKEDEYFGKQEIYRKEVAAKLRLDRVTAEAQEPTLKLSYQGCADAGICYPPIRKSVPIKLAAVTRAEAAEASPPAPAEEAAVAAPAASDGAAAPAAQPPAAAPPEAEQDRIARMLTERGFGAMPAFFGFGLLLAFTPCIFPMIPILSSIIVGQGEDITRWHGFMLSLIYVLAMAITYTIAGVLAALLGQNIQAMFQNPYVLVTFALMFVALSMAMFGFYELQLPASWQSKLTEVSNSQRGGTYAGVAIMGLLSALIVGPCVAAPLIGILAVLAATGDVMLGGTALFVLSIGMGAPLLAIGASGGQFLPRAGHWMEAVKSIFGVVLLAMAIWMLERVLPPSVTMLMWAMLLISTAIYMGALRSAGEGVSGWQNLVRGLGVVLLIYGVLLLVGVAAGGKDALQPLKGVAFAKSGAPGAGAAPAFKERFRKVENLGELRQVLAEAGEQGRPAMLDFTAEWCISCKELEKFTFSDPAVQEACANAVLIEADVTDNDEEDTELLQHFGLFGPPAILFFDAEGNERKTFRVVGFMPAEEFRDIAGYALIQ